MMQKYSIAFKASCFTVVFIIVMITMQLNINRFPSVSEYMSSHLGTVDTAAIGTAFIDLHDAIKRQY